MILEILLDIFFALLIVACVLWVIVRIYSTHKERLREERIENLERLNNLLEKHKYTKGANSVTCKEKLKLEHPEYTGTMYHGGCKGCPADYGYRDKTVNCHGSGCIHDCDVCWDQPVETKAFSKELTDVQKLYMDALKAMSTYAGTKPDDRKSKYAESAQEMFALYSAFKDAGFNDNQAFGLTRTAFANATHNQNKE